LRGRVRYHATPRMWIAATAQYNSGLPIEIEEPVNVPFLVQQYGQAVVDRVAFDEGRVRPSSSIDASCGWELLKTERRSMRVQADVFNITNRLNVINFAGLLSGTAIGPRRTFTVRLTAAF